MRRHAIFFLLTALALGPQARATSPFNTNWNGNGGANHNVGNSTNWDVTPPIDGSASLVFGSSAANNSVNLDSSFTANGLQFTGGSYTFTGSGGTTLSLGTGGVVTSGGSSDVASLDSSLNVQLTADQTWNVTSSLSAGGPISGGYALTKSGTGTLTLSGSNTFSGGLTLAGGTLRINGSGATGSGTLTLSDGVTVGTGTATSSFTVSNAVTVGNNVTLLDSQSNTAELHFSGQATLASANTTLTLSSSNKAVFFEGGLTAANPSSTVTFNGNSSGGIAVLEGTTNHSTVAEIDASDAAVIFTNNGALPATRIQASFGGYIGMVDGFSTTSSYSPATLLGLITDKANFAGTIGFDTAPNSSTNVFTGTIDLTGFTGSNFAGLGSFTSAVLDGNAIIKPPSSGSHSGVLQLTGLDGTLTVSAPLLTSNGVSSVVIGNDATSRATGKVVLTSSSNNYTGGTQLQSGTLLIGASNVLGSGVISTPSGSSYPALAAASSGLTLTNSFNLSGNGLVIGVDNAGKGLTLTGVIAGTGILGIHDTTTLSGINTVAGIVVDKNSSLTLDTDTPTASTGSFNIQWGSVAFTAAAAAPVIGSLSGTTSGALTLAPATGAKLTIDQTTNDHYYGTISDGGSYAGSIVKTGSSKLHFDGSNSYSGTTTISGGGLIADNAHAFGTSALALDGGGLGLASGVTLTNSISFTANGGKLGGLGTFSPSSGLTIGTNIALFPGSVDTNGPGKLSFGSAGLTLASGGTIAFRIQSVGTGNSSVDAGSSYGSVAVGGPLNITATSGNRFSIALYSLNSDGNAGAVGDFNANNSYSWLLFSASGGITNFNLADFSFDTTSFSNSLAGGAFGLSLANSNTQLFLNFTPVPEPTTYALLGVGLALLFVENRKRRRRAGARRR